jgi:lipopolysaccharide export system ATP-binding protein
MLCGLIRPESGQVVLDGQDVTDWPMHVRARHGGMGYLPQQSSVFARLSAQDNLLGIMQLLGIPRRQRKTRCVELLEQFRIMHVRRTAAGRLSGGERRRLEIARCLIANPRIIMLDEPFAGIDPVTVQNIQVIIRGLAESGIAILITDHAAREILQITDRTYVVSEGRILCSGTPSQIVEHEEVRQKYLGEIDFVQQRPGRPHMADGPRGTAIREPAAAVKMSRTDLD